MTTARAVTFPLRRPAPPRRLAEEPVDLDALRAKVARLERELGVPSPADRELAEQLGVPEETLKRVCREQADERRRQRLANPSRDLVERDTAQLFGVTAAQLAGARAAEPQPKGASATETELSIAKQLGVSKDMIERSKARTTDPALVALIRGDKPGELTASEKALGRTFGLTDETLARAKSGTPTAQLVVEQAAAKMGVKS